MLRQCVAELAALLADHPDPDDPAVERLFPDVYPEDPAEAAEFRRFTEADLKAAKLDTAKTVLSDLLENGGEIRLAEEAGRRLAAGPQRRTAGAGHPARRLGRHRHRGGARRGGRPQPGLLPGRPALGLCVPDLAAGIAGPRPHVVGLTIGATLTIGAALTMGRQGGGPFGGVEGLRVGLPPHHQVGAGDAAGLGATTRLVGPASPRRRPRAVSWSSRAVRRRPAGRRARTARRARGRAGPRPAPPPRRGPTHRPAPSPSPTPAAGPRRAPCGPRAGSRCTTQAGHQVGSAAATWAGSSARVGAEPGQHGHGQPPGADRAASASSSPIPGSSRAVRRTGRCPPRAGPGSGTARGG